MEPDKRDTSIQGAINMFFYKDKSVVRYGDKVLVSKRWADEHANGNRRGTVVGLCGFVCVKFEENGSEVDFDMRSITNLSPTC
jgi:hypothetical protein